MRKMSDLVMEPTDGLLILIMRNILRMSRTLLSTGFAAWDRKTAILSDILKELAKERNSGLVKYDALSATICLGGP